MGEHIGIYAGEQKIRAACDEQYDLVDESTKYNWCHRFFVAILLWTSAQ